MKAIQYQNILQDCSFGYENILYTRASLLQQGSSMPYTEKTTKIFIYYQNITLIGHQIIQISISSIKEE